MALRFYESSNDEADLKKQEVTLLPKKAKGL